MTNTQTADVEATVAQVSALAEAGCDLVLHCNGKMDEMRAVASEAPELSGAARRRADAALAVRKSPAGIDLPAARREFAAMMTSGIA